MRAASAAIGATLWATVMLAGDAYAPVNGQFESFNDVESLQEAGWLKSETSEARGEWELSQGDLAWHGHDEGDFSLITKLPAQRHTVSKKLSKSINPGEVDQIVIEYETRYQNYIECAGSYMKLLSRSIDDEDTPVDSGTDYSIMFGPDKCGPTDKVHFIVKHKSPATNKITEHHYQKTISIVNDRFTHQYRLEIYKDNSFIIKVDDVVKAQGNLLDPTDFSPSIIPPETIPDTNDKKPETWNDIAKIPDPHQTKPSDWDEDQPKMIPDENAVMPDNWDESALPNILDPDAKQPADWDSEQDGEWEAPLIDNPICSESGCGPWTAPLVSNPQYKGKWKPDMIDNPEYDGIWFPKQIPNPEYFTTDDATKGMSPITDMAFELWTMQVGLEFDNIYVGTSIAEADKITMDYFKIKHEKEVEAQANISPPQHEAPADSEGKTSGTWAINQVKAAMNIVSANFEAMTNNPMPFLGTFFAGIVVFLVYLWKQAGPATNEMMQQAKMQKAAVSDPKKAASKNADQNAQQQGEDSAEGESSEDDN